MSAVTSADVRAFIKDYLVRQSGVKKAPVLDDLPAACNLLLFGMVIDLIGFCRYASGIRHTFKP